MKADNGFIVLHRKLLDWEWHDEPNTMAVFLTCLLLANFRDTKWHGIDVERGSFITSIGNLAKQTGLTVKKTRTALEHLIKCDVMASKGASKYTLLTVVNYSKYQDLPDERASETASKGQTKGEQRANKGQQRNKVTREQGNNTRERAKKVNYADNVSMTEDEYGKLIAQYGHDTARLIEILQNYKAASGKKYASDYAAILNWVVKRLAEEKAKGIVKSEPSYNLEAFKAKSKEPPVYKKKGDNG